MSAVSSDFEKTPWLALPALLALVVALLAYAWLGFISDDDRQYALAAAERLDDIHALGDTHWSLRQAVVLPVTASFALLGPGEFALALPSALYFLALLALTYWGMARAVDHRAALLAVALVGTLPLFLLHATIASADVAGLFFVALSCWLFWHAANTKATQRYALLLAAGLAAGGAWLSHELVVALIAYYGLLFLGGYRYRRREYWLLALGFAIVLGIEWYYFSLVTDDPLYRLRIVFDHSKAFVGTTTTSGAGNPGRVVLINHEYGVLFYLSPLLAVVLWRQPLTHAERTLAWFLIGLALCWFVVVAFGSELRFPRYFSVSAYAASLVCAVWLAERCRAQRRGAALVVAAALFASYALALYIDNKNPLYGERALRDYLLQHPGEVIYTDPSTAHLARLYLRWSGLEDAVSPRPPPPGARLFFSPRRVYDTTKYAKSGQFDANAYTPPPDAQLLWQRDPGRKLSGYVISALGLAAWLPPAVVQRLDRPNPPVAVYRIAP